MRLLSLILFACSSDPEPVDGDTDDPGDGAPAADYAARGAWPVGTRTHEATGTDGLSLRVQVWYPAEEAGSSTILYDGLFAGDAYDGATPDCAAARPLVAFSHGSSGVRYQSW